MSAGEPRVRFPDPEMISKLSLLFNGFNINYFLSLSSFKSPSMLKFSWGFFWWRGWLVRRGGSECGCEIEVISRDQIPNVVISSQTQVNHALISSCYVPIEFCVWCISIKHWLWKRCRDLLTHGVWVQLNCKLWCHFFACRRLVLYMYSIGVLKNVQALPLRFKPTNALLPKYQFYRIRTRVAFSRIK